MISSPRSCFLITVLLLLIMNLGTGQSKSWHCDPDGPAIRSPFKLIHANDTDNSGFGLSCSDNNTILQLPTVPDPVRLLVKYISYEYQRLYAIDPDNCAPKVFLKFYNSSIYPYQLLSYQGATNITFFDCSSIRYRYLKNRFWLQPAQNMFSCPIYAAGHSNSIIQLDLLSCTRMFDVLSPISASDLQYNEFSLKWTNPHYVLGEKHKPKMKISAPTIIGVIGSIVLVLLLLAFFQIYGYFRMKSEDQARVEKFLEDYRALKPARFSYADIKRITNRFKDELGEGAHGAVFKGKLSDDIHVAVKILSNTEGEGKEFINEVGTMGKIHHVNVVRLLGFCADGFHRALIYDYFPNGSLQKFLCPPGNNNFLGWDKLQQIALGIAKGLEYLHQGCDNRILHFDINPHNVLLDDNFTPKITDFGLAKLCSKNQSTVSMTAARGTLGYIAPEVFSRNFGNVSYKSDIYSYGMLLLEMVGGRKNIDKSIDEKLQVLYPDWIHNLLEGKDIHIQIDDEGDIKIATKLAVVGLWCIQWHPIERPSMKSVIQMLEGEVDELKMPPNSFDSSTSSNTSVITPTKHLNLALDVIHELD